MNDGCIPFSCSSFGVLVLCVPPHWDTWIERSHCNTCAFPTLTSQTVGCEKVWFNKKSRTFFISGYFIDFSQWKLALPFSQQQSSVGRESTWSERLAVVVVAALWVRADDVITRETAPSVMHEKQATSVTCCKDRSRQKDTWGRGLTCVCPGAAVGGRLFLRGTFSLCKYDSRLLTSPWVWWHHGRTKGGRGWMSAACKAIKFRFRLAWNSFRTPCTLSQANECWWSTVTWPIFQPSAYGNLHNPDNQPPRPHQHFNQPAHHVACSWI